MADDKEPMQADGTGGPGTAVANENDPPSAGRPDMEDNPGESGGGPYPSPHNDPQKADAEDGFMGHGGQSDMRYYGDGQLGSAEVGESGNAVTEDED
ncbi:MAG: hypothetical protein ACM3ZV_11105 [Bacillota bacterium]